MCPVIIYDWFVLWRDEENCKGQDSVENILVRDVYLVSYYCEEFVPRQRLDTTTRAMTKDHLHTCSQDTGHEGQLRNVFADE